MLDASSSSFEFRQCLATACRFRFPVATDDPRRDLCPHCSTPTVVAEQSVAREMPSPHFVDYAQVHALLDNVRSLFNVGSIFRSADGAGIGHLYLAGITPTPAHPKLAKTALGAEKHVGWSHHRNSLDLAHQLCENGVRLWALESTSESRSLFSRLASSR
ncbi:MAG: RNA methyltransferase [Caldilineaceae bacterium]|nr:RNA methyltransferase [Caldilineaceae bacterium]